jgi:hypothetical protein
MVMVMRRRRRISMSLRIRHMPLTCSARRGSPCAIGAATATSCI